MPGIFLDRDGTLNDDPGFVHDPEDLSLRDGVQEGLSRLHDTGLPIVVVTNQSGIALDRFSQADSVAFFRALEHAVDAKDFQFAGYYWCPHRPEAEGRLGRECPCRKPATGLLRKAAHELSIDLEESFLVGDRSTDLEAGSAVGAETVLVPSTYTEEPTATTPDYRAETFGEAARWIQQKTTVQNLA